MKVSYEWLKEFVALAEPASAVADRLSLAGLEVAGLTPAVPALEGLVIGQVLEVGRHPDADKLSVCRVSTGAGSDHQIVCGAPNVRAGMKAPVILPGSKLPDGTKIRKAKLRGVESAGMLCSARELGLSEDHTGLMDLPADAPVGDALAAYLGGDDTVIEIEITPNRGDCLSALGIARDLAALYQQDMHIPASPPVAATIADTVAVDVSNPEGCPAFLGRVIRDIDPQAQTPLWMRERLRRSGIRPISPAVDVTQYVMLELGQPMHAYDLRQIRGGIKVRFAQGGEKLGLLDGSEAALQPDMLVIADHERSLGLAGIMGGQGSGIADDTCDLYLECAYFDPTTINGRPRRLGVQTDAGYRFERGVDPAGQRRAIERATALLLEIAGGEAGPVTEARDATNQPPRPQIGLRRTRLEALLGVVVPDARVADILTRLGMSPEVGEAGWSVRAPSHRFDIEIEEDLVEEVGRVYGYEHIEPAQYPAVHGMVPVPEAATPLPSLRQALVQRGYQEVITYSFVARDLQERVTGQAGIELANPITAEMTHMRTSLWPGLIQSAAYNLNRQQNRIRIFECGLIFNLQDNDIKQKLVIGGLVSGSARPEQWAEPDRAVDFADVKGDVAALFGASEPFSCEPAPHPALHPGQSARVLKDGVPVGWLGALHPALAEDLGLDEGSFAFELALDALQAGSVPRIREISRFPAIRRDLALVVDEELPVGRLEALVREEAGDLLREQVIFDIYRGPGVDSGRKSIALGLILQDSSRTLTDDTVDRVISDIVSRLGRDLGATIRD